MVGARGARINLEQVNQCMAMSEWLTAQEAMDRLRLKPQTLYLTDADWKAQLARHIVRDLTPFQTPEGKGSVDAGGVAP